MPSLVISIDAAFIQEVALTKERTTIGRRPYNDIVLSNLAVSGEHARLHCAGGRIILEDLQSTNGTYVNHQRITRQQLQHGDLLDIGKYQLRLQLSPPEIAAQSVAEVADTAYASLLLLDTPGREVRLLKDQTTLGKPGQAVAVITREATGFSLARTEGEDGSLLLNGQNVGSEAQRLQHGDQFELAGSRLQFLLQPAQKN